MTSAAGRWNFCADMQAMPAIRNLLLIFATGSSCALSYAADPAADYPNHPIRLVVPFPPGGGTDIVARAISGKLTEAWGQQIIIDNRGGAGGVIGADTVAKSTPDGYTLLLGTPGALVINPLLNSKLPYNAARDFAPVSLLALNPQLLAVHHTLPVNSVKELIAFAKAQPGKLNYASVGEGTPNHLAMELFKSMTGTEMAHVPYKGAAPAITDLVGGHVQLMFNPMPPLLPHVRSGRLRALAVGGLQRSSALPDIPTVAEAGVPGYEYVTWYSIVAPAKTTRAIINKINARLAAVLAMPDVAQRLSSQGAEPHSSTPEELTAFMLKDTQRLGGIIRFAGIKSE
ncbi:MAG: tripartite tricarboxylate transporter substrate binding protein [Burkholderiales bacterium]